MYNSKAKVLKAVVYFESKPDRALVVEEVTSILSAKNYEFLEVTDDRKDATIIVLIEELRYEEDNLQERTQTEQVGYYDIDYLTRRYYPEGGTALYDLYTGGSEIDYAYCISAKQKGKNVFKKTIKELITSDYRYAQNLRYKNVFGGGGPTNALPNDYVRGLFSRSKNRTAARELRSKVHDHLVSTVSHTACRIMSG